MTIKPAEFLGDSIEILRAFPDKARQDAGFQLDKVQRGEEPDDSKPMPGIGAGVKEIRILDEAGTFRVNTWRSSPTRFMSCTAFRRRRRRRARKTSNWRGNDTRN